MYIMSIIDKKLNSLDLTHIATGYPHTIILNSKETQLAMDNTSSLNHSWDLMCQSVYSRLGEWIPDNFEVNFITVEGETKTFH
jgi:hypothetical protein